MSPSYHLVKQGDLWMGRFTAMACPCEILIDTKNEALAQSIVEIAQSEALRIQQKFSRYETNNIVWRINNANGETINLDTETALLLNFANQCYQLSDGLFDITAGALGKIWKFDGTSNLPSQDRITEILALVGWQKITLTDLSIQMPTGMQIDFGGIGKEYAVDRSLMLIRQKSETPVLVNFGGDLAVSGAREDNQPWQVGIEIPDKNREADFVLEISAGALATSGDARRFLLANEIRYGHILNPFTGWPIQHAPRSVTVASGNCLQAGMLSTFGILKGAEAENFLEEQGVQFWILR